MRRLCALFGAFLALTLGGCAAISSEQASRSPIDPLEPYNRAMFEFNRTVDDFALIPIAKAYRNYLPEAFRVPVRNFFDNLWDASSAINQLLQGKPLMAGNDLLRFGVNSVFGFFGIADLASELGLEKHREDFGQTLGVWGVPTGPYLVLPLFGPSSFRDGTGLLVDFKTDLVSQLTDNATRRYAIRTVFIVDTRERILDATQMIEKVALDRYLFVRDSYLQRRRNLVWDGNPPPLDRDDDAAPRSR